MEVLDLAGDMTYHDAGNDATYTARIGAELVRRFGAALRGGADQMEAELRRERRERAAAEASQAGPGASGQDAGLPPLLRRVPRPPR